jgi:hypothetical protein
MISWSKYSTNKGKQRVNRHCRRVDAPFTLCPPLPSSRLLSPLSHLNVDAGCKLFPAPDRSQGKGTSERIAARNGERAPPLCPSRSRSRGNGKGRRPPGPPFMQQQHANPNSARPFFVQRARKLGFMMEIPPAPVCAQRGDANGGRTGSAPSPVPSRAKGADKRKHAREREGTPPLSYARW